MRIKNMFIFSHHSVFCVYVMACDPFKRWNANKLSWSTIFMSCLCHSCLCFCSSHNKKKPACALMLKKNECQIPCNYLDVLAGCKLSFACSHYINWRFLLSCGGFACSNPESGPGLAPNGTWSIVDVLVAFFPLMKVTGACEDEWCIISRQSVSG